MKHTHTIKYVLKRSFEGEVEEVVLNAMGTIEHKDNILKITFKEDYEEMIDVNTEITIKDGKAFINRSGTVIMKQVFEPDKQTDGEYIAEGIKMDLHVYTNSLLLEKDVLKLNYILFINSQDVGQYDLNIYFEEVNEKDGTN